METTSKEHSGEHGHTGEAFSARSEDTGIEPVDWLEGLGREDRWREHWAVAMLYLKTRTTVV